MNKKTISKTRFLSSSGLNFEGLVELFSPLSFSQSFPPRRRGAESSQSHPQNPIRIGTQSEKAQRGLVTIPFLIAFIIVMFLILSFFRLTLTLTYASVVQYITYSSARRLSLGDDKKDTQERKGREKYDQLTSELLKQSTWFDISGPQKPYFNTEYTESGHRNLFYGVFVSFTSNLISFRIPLLAEDGDQGLTTTIGSYLGREPSQQDECEGFNTAKKDHMKTILDSYGVSHNFPSPAPYDNVGSDNGC